jgi:hypothetical protein
MAIRHFILINVKGEKKNYRNVSGDARYGAGV